MSSNPWGPDEPAAVVASEEIVLQGFLLSAIAYGALLVLFIQSFFLLWKQTNRTNYRKKLPFLIIVILLFMLGTFFMGPAMKVTQRIYIEDRNYPGGPSAYGSAMYSAPLESLGNVSNVLNQWLCDALFIWRYMMIFQQTIVPTWIVMFLPVLLFLGSFALGILWLLQVSASSPFATSGMNWTIPFLTVSLAINVLITIAIVTRLLVFRRRIASVLGPNHGSQYTSVAAMIIESAAISSIFDILFIIPFALNKPISQTFIEPLEIVQGCSTLLIILRAASGKAWSAETQRTLLSTLECATRPSGTLGSIRTNGIPATIINSYTNELPGSFDPSYKSASTILAINEKPIVTDIETDAVVQSLDESSPRSVMAANVFEAV